MDWIEKLLGFGKSVLNRPTTEVEITRLSELIGQPFIVKIHALTAVSYTHLRAELQQKMDDLVHTADMETRAMTAEEAAQFDAAEQEIRAIDDTVAREERARGLQHNSAAGELENRAAEEEQAFAAYVLGRAAELRAGEQNMTCLLYTSRCV